MTAIVPDHQGTGPVFTNTTPIAVIPARRRLTVAALKRSARRRATWIRHDMEDTYMVELPLVTIITGAAAVMALTLAAVGSLVFL